MCGAWQGAVVACSGEVGLARAMVTAVHAAVQSPAAQHATPPLRERSLGEPLNGLVVPRHDGVHRHHVVVPQLALALLGLLRQRVAHLVQLWGRGRAGTCQQPVQLQAGEYGDDLQQRRLLQLQHCMPSAAWQACGPATEHVGTAQHGTAQQHLALSHGLAWQHTTA
jgi:hypothetical protein